MSVDVIRIDLTSQSDFVHSLDSSNHASIQFMYLLFLSHFHFNVMKHGRQNARRVIGNVDERSVTGSLLLENPKV